MTAVDAITAADSLSEAFKPTGNSRLLLTFDSIESAEARAEERRLRQQVDDIPAWILQAEMFYVDSGMVPLICSATAVMPDDTVVEVYDPPSPFGFLLIGGGATLCHLIEPGEDGEISAEVFNAFLWATFSGHIHVQRFHRLPDQVWGLIDSTPLPIGERLPPPARPRDRRYPRRLVIPGGQLHEDQSRVALPLGQEARDLMAAPNTGATDAALRWLMACWRLMHQTLVDVAGASPTRQQRRQLERRNVAVRQVSVIKLRHKGTHADGGTVVNWSHRWVVRGHWRQQRVKDETGKWTTRPVFIHPYIKGPDSAPLLVRRRVNHLIR